VFTEESDNIALTESEIDALSKLDLKNEIRLDAVRDMFVLGCYSGLRWSDFTDIKPENIKKHKNGQVIDIIQTKTKNQVVIPVNNSIAAILKKYNNQLPEPISNQKFNEYIKEIAKMIPELNTKETIVVTKGGKTTEEIFSRWELISSHTARRSFATNSFEKGIEVKLIRAITGHKSDKSFYSYIKTSKTKQAEMFGELNK
jgi:integrase